MKFDVENMKEFQQLLKQAETKTGELIDVMKKINEFDLKVDVKKADYEESTKE